ncbi:hypothetical protein HDU81_010755 [Chytriomyces hyalinus]|nr:hypothetical protein HDU81_010755 [Chytriomyces hyalinus]
MADWWDPQTQHTHHHHLTNSGNRIWTDRNCLPWAKQYLTRNLKIVHGGAFVITSVASIDGDCVLNQKRGKTMPVYDLQIVLTWKGTDSNGAHASGQISIPEFMHDSDLADIEMIIAVDDKKQQVAVRKEIMNALIPAVKEVLAGFKRDLVAENTKSTEKNSQTPASTDKKENTTTPNIAPHQAPKLDPVWIAPPSSATSKLKTASFGLETQFACTASDIYDSFLNPERVKIWTRDKGVVLDPRPGQEMVLFGGNVSGRIFELVPCSKIVFTWRLKSWPSSLQSSLVTLLIDEFDKVVRVRVKHVDAPADEIPVIKRNWEAYYFTPIRESLHILATIPKVTAVVAAKPLVNAEEFERIAKSDKTAQGLDQSHDSKEGMRFWHWIERNCMNWAKSHLKKRLGAIAANQFSITGVSSVTGQADINQRKGRLITVFDLAITIEWKGPNGVTGTIEIPEFMHDTEMDELEVQISTSDSKAASDAKKLLIPKIKTVFETFSQEMIHENSNNLLQDSTANSTPSATPVRQNSASPAAQPSPSFSPSPLPTLLSQSSAASKKPKTAPISLESQFMCSSDELYDTLVNPARIKMWTRDTNAVVEAKENVPFVLFGGNVTGRFVELAPCSQIVKSWRLKNWSSHSTMVTITLHRIEGDTAVRLELKQTGVPVDEVDAVKQNWEKYYFEPIRACLPALAGVPRITAAPAKGVDYDGFDEKAKGGESGSLYAKVAVCVAVVAVLYYSLQWK